MTAAELVAAGWHTDQIRASTRRGDLMLLRRGIYADGEKARKLASLAGGDQLLAVAAATALVRPGAVVSHQSAAYLHNIDLVGRRDVTVHLTRPPGGGWQGRAGIQLHAASLPGQHVTTIVGLPVTSAARTVIDLARVLQFQAGVVVADSALHQRLASRDDLRSVLATCRRWPGTRAAADVIEFADGRAESPLESLARIVFRDCGLPRPQLQALIGDTDDVARVDFYWPQYRTIAEVDGAVKYADTTRAIAQLDRDRWLRTLGYEVVHFTWDDITARPQWVGPRVEDAFRRGALLATVSPRPSPSPALTPTPTQGRRSRPDPAPRAAAV